ncbi:TonB family protein [Phenylobacterium sp.]|uniref:TonB family protein n=1 Tax=Phenylobacterium sp. TaxID=1871053 RepID=UPI002CAA4B62|nr:TonB family protein [Phenylobacterium sp.]HLZ75320.1 TonB family protein [Phenylobacterium sp.]
MKAQLLMLSAAGLLLAASAAPSAALATPSQQLLMSAQVQTQVDRRLSAVGVDSASRPISVRATVAPDGHVTGVAVLQSSGAPEIDRKVATVLQRVLLANPPVGLLDGAVTLNVGGGRAAEVAGR